MWCCSRFIILIALFYYVHGDCRIDSIFAEQSNYLFTYDGLNQLVRTDNVRENDNLLLICNSGNKKSQCEAGKFSPRLPSTSCKKPIPVTVEEVNEMEVYGTRICQSSMLRVGYKYANNFYEVYKSCYNKDQMTPIFALHDTYKYTGATKRPEQGFFLDGSVTGMTGAIELAFRAPNMKERFNNLLGVKHTYNPSFDRGHLVPSADFFFDNNMRSTFRYLNVAPQCSTLNRGNWKKVENWVRNKLASDVSGTAFHICTGVIEVLQLTSVNGQRKDIFLSTKNGKSIIPIPKYVYKIIYDGTAVVIFVSYNYVDGNAAPPKICTIRTTCPITFDNGYTYCCDPNEFKRKYPSYVCGFY